MSAIDPARIALNHSEVSYQALAALPNTTTVTRLAPPRSRTFDASFAVAPVVKVSSTMATCSSRVRVVAARVVAAKAPRTFCGL